jgi:hypothetical protein
MPEQAVSDNKGHLYVDIEDKANVAVVDVKTLTVTAHYDLEGKGGTCAGLAFDAKNPILFAACRNPPNMVMLNADDGKIIIACQSAWARTAPFSIRPRWKPSARRATARSPSSKRTARPASSSSRTS